MPKRSAPETPAVEKPTKQPIKRQRKEKTDGADKKRGPPKPTPPRSIIMRLFKRHAGGKTPRGPVYELLQELFVKYCQSIYEQTQAVHKNNGSKTLIYKDLQLLATVSYIAGATPPAQELKALAQRLKDEAQKAKDETVKKTEKKTETKSETEEKAGAGEESKTETAPMVTDA